MSISEEENLMLIKSIESVDTLNKEFYSKFPYPWPPMKFEWVTDPTFETTFLNQSIGDWTLHTLPPHARIWVAGCGTNQALFTALKFPKAQVIGSDLSTPSLEHSARIAKEMGLKNLEMREESINDVAYDNVFDYIICTGVIHHNADPTLALKRLSRALKANGVLELMVYNRFHRRDLAALQRAIRILKNADINQTSDFTSELEIARAILSQDSLDNPLSNFYRQSQDLPEPLLADTLIQPVEYSYTVETLAHLAEACNLEYLVPCMNIFDAANNQFIWDLQFEVPQLQKKYEDLPDMLRWQVTNLLLLEKSPMLWFYLHHQDSGRSRKTEKQICEEFLATTFVKANAVQRNYVRGSDKKYKLSSHSFAYPGSPTDHLLKRVFDAVDGCTPMHDVFKQLSLDTSSFTQVNKIRIQLTSVAFPFLRALPERL